jgi:hypothetical protein
MSRYKKIAVQMWGDLKFRSLSPPPPNGRDCWIHLLTNRENTSIPGVYHAYKEGLARDLEWPLKDYLKVFEEVYAKGMVKVDWEVGFIFIPNAIRHNQPESPNVIKGWKKHWLELPECPLKAEAYQHLKGFLIAFKKDNKKGFLEAFEEVIPKDPVTVTVLSSLDLSKEGKNIQEQKKEKGGVGERESSALNGFGRFKELYPIWKEEEEVKRAWKRIPKSEHEAIFQAVEAYKQSADWQKEAGKFIPYPAKFLKKGRWKDKIEPALTISDAARTTLAAGQRLVEAAGQSSDPVDPFVEKAP